MKVAAVVLAAGEATRKRIYDINTPKDYQRLSK